MLFDLTLLVTEDTRQKSNLFGNITLRATYLS